MYTLLSIKLLKKNVMHRLKGRNWPKVIQTFNSTYTTF